MADAVVPGLQCLVHTTDLRQGGSGPTGSLYTSEDFSITLQSIINAQRTFSGRAAHARAARANHVLICQLTDAFRCVTCVT